MASMARQVLLGSLARTVSVASKAKQVPPAHLAMKAMYGVKANQEPQALEDKTTREESNARQS